MSELIIDSNNCINLIRIDKEKLSDDKKRKVWEKHERFKNNIDKISDIIKQCVILNIISLENNYTIIFSRRADGERITFEIENVVKIIKVSYVDKENPPIGFNIGNLDLNNIYRFNLSYDYSMAQHLSLQYDKDIFGIMFWDIHDKVMPKSNIWAERLIIKGNIDLSDIDI